MSEDQKLKQLEAAADSASKELALLEVILKGAKDKAQAAADNAAQELALLETIINSTKKAGAALSGSPKAAEAAPKAEAPAAEAPKPAEAAPKAEAPVAEAPKAAEPPAPVKAELTLAEAPKAAEPPPPKAEASSAAEAAPAPPAPRKAEPKAESGDPVTIRMLGLAREKGQATIFDRAAKMKPCNIGTEGICCKICSQGPCRIPLTKAIKDGSEPDTRIGLCGATPETIVMRNLIRMISAGSAAHSDHGLDLVETLQDVGNGVTGEYGIKDEEKLRAMGKNLGLGDWGSLGVRELAKEVAEKCLREWGGQHGELEYLKLAPKDAYDRWTEQGVKPRGINREAVEIMHRTHMGVDQDYRNLMFQGVRCAISDGWSSSIISTEIQDVFFGAPTPRESTVNLGALSGTEVNVVVHGQYPLLAEKLIEAAAEPDMVAYAKGKGAEGIRISGMCATGSEIQERHGLSGAGDYLQQELAVVTGAVDVLVVDAQCAMEALGKICECYHTKLITTMGKARFDGAANNRAMEVSDVDAGERAREILRIAADNFPNRKEVNIPEGQSSVMVGYGLESLGKILGANGSGPLGPLAAAIAAGEIKGVAGIIGCNNVRTVPGASGEDPHVDLARALIKDDVLVMTTGCAAMACGRAGLLTQAAAEGAGPKLKAFCEKRGLPPALHMGSCVDNSRLLLAMAELAKSGSLGGMKDIPAAVAAPGWTSEQIVAACFYFAASGIDVVLGVTLPIQGLPMMNDFLDKSFAEKYGGSIRYRPDPVAAAEEVSGIINSKRSALGIK
ncbi:MAG: anaerobic carbon-monoxide dehydrogenase catalytic subunit [Deltaproteobacteria bacterium]|jgi:carbon-monoxide dehydrogenase catalytic subunit|nr:anaerobic carbon-monoxide dehydrogenase catalytic subunit [Deltaproteobacteria bacterium]